MIQPDRRARTGEPVLVPDRRVPAARGGYVVLLCIAFPLSHFPAMEFSGAHITLAPIFYLLGMRLWGLGPGLAAAILLTAPFSLLPSDMGMTLFAIGQVLFLWHLRRREMLLAETASLYQLLALPFAAFFLMDLGRQSPPMLLMSLVQFPLVNLVLVAIADAFLQNFELAPATGLPMLRRSRSLDGSLRAMINLVVALLFSAALFNEAESLDRLESGYRAQVHALVQDLQPASVPAGAIDRVASLQLYDGTRLNAYVSGVAKGFARRAEQHIPSCRRFVSRTPPTHGLADMVAWASICEIDQVKHGEGALWVASSMSGALATRYWWASGELVLLLVAATFALGYRFALTRSLRATLASSLEVIEHFGEPDLPLPPRQAFREFDEPMRRFVTTHNEYLAALEQRDHLVGVADELKNSVELQLIRDIRFDPDIGLLSFIEGDFHDQADTHQVLVHAADRAYFLPIRQSDAAMVEYRVAGAELLGSGLTDHSQKSTVAASAIAEKKTVGQRS